MAKKLYLVRRNLETIFGPMNFEQFKDGFEHMEFGLQDEIASHCSKWVFLENTRVLKRKYPEIHEYVYQNLRTWSDGLQNKIYDTRNNRPPPVKKTNKMWIPVVLLLLVFGGYFIHKEGLLNNIQVGRSKNFTVIDANKLLKEDKISLLEEKMKSNIQNILTRNKGSDIYEWLPIIRWYAYHKDGEVTGVPPQFLKGTVDEISPDNCSIKSLRDMFFDSIPQWREFIIRRQLVDGNWAKILAWDPHWVKRRTQAGWVKPESYFGACVYMGLKVFYSISSDQEFMARVNSVYKDSSNFFIHTIKNRLAWLSYIINGTTKPNLNFDRKQTDLISIWSCMENSLGVGELNRCYEFDGSRGVEWKAYTDYRYLFNLVKPLMFDEQTGPTLLNQFDERILSLIKNSDPFTKLDIRAELSFLRHYLKEKGDVYKSLQRVRVEFIDVDLTRSYQW
ncbi:MAG: hypothetical protein AB8G05_00120 [Oligoflexales bacterium]